MLDAQLHAPRLLQASLPRMLRPRRGHPASLDAELVPGRLGKKPAGHVRVTLLDNLGPSHLAADAATSSKRPQPKVAGAARGLTGKSKGKVHAVNQAAAVSAVEVADVGRTLKPADLNVSLDSTAPVADGQAALDADARGSRRQRRRAVAQKESSADKRAKEQSQGGKETKTVADCETTGVVCPMASCFNQMHREQFEVGKP